MNILKLRKDANECTWLAADKVEFIDVVDANTIDLRCLGTSDDLAYDEVAITATGKSSEVAEILAGHIHQSATQKGGIINVSAISGVTSIAALTAA
tara:strand:+ start:736 stop:1023 length:288 start_codon:yes stop_codon:yes gene_type:complete